MGIMGIAVVLTLSLLLGVTDAAPKPEEAGVHSTITLNTDDNKKGMRYSTHIDILLTRQRNKMNDQSL